MNLLKLAGWTWIAVAMASAQTEDREADKQALRSLAARYETAINQGSFAGLQDSVAPELSAVFMTGVEVRGLPEMQAYYDKIKAKLGSGGSYSVKLDPAATDFHGDIAVAHGSSAETVVLGNGKRIAYRSQWTAVLRKIDGQWAAARLHVSIDPIDNPFVTLRLRATKGICLAIGVVAGLLVAWVIARYLGRRRQISA